MEYQASSVALSQKLSNGHSIYDGVFSSAAASKFNVSTFSSRVDDYSEIFGGSGASRGGSSIPVLDVPELHERKASVDVRSSKLDYSNVFGGFGDSDFAVPYEELFREPKKKERRASAEKRSPAKEADPSSTEGNRVLSHEASYESFDGAKKFNMSYHKTNHRSKSFTGGTMLHAVPAYTCLIDEVSPVRTTESDKPVPSKENGASPDNNLCERMTEGNHLKAARDLPAGDDRNQTSAGGAKVQNNYDRKISSSHYELFDASETHSSSSPSISIPLSEGKVDFGKPMASIFGVARSDHLEGSGRVSSPPYFDEEVDTNSTAAASAAVLIKAIEEAQARINMAKESKERKKTSSQNRVKPSFNNGTKFEVKGDKFVDKVSIPKERKTRELHEEGAVPVNVSTGTKLEVRGDKFADKVSIPKERKTRELHEEVAVPVHDYASTKLEVKGDTFADKVSIPKERKTRELHEEVAVPVHDSSTKLEVKGDKFADKVSTPKERKTRELHEEVAVPVHVSTSTKLEVKGDKFADKVSLPKERKIQELREEVAVPVHFSIFSTGLKQVTAALDDANKNFGPKEAGGTTEEKESISTHMGHTQEQTDVPEAAEQFYEVSETGEPDFSEAAEQFYEFSDTSEPDLSEPAEFFYEFSDSSEHLATTVEDEEANPAIKMIQIVDEDEQKRKKTTMEDFETPELGGERLQAAKYEDRELEKIFNADEGPSKCEDHAIELETVKDAFDQEENENRLEASREHEETWKLQSFHVKEILEEKPVELEKQKGDNKRHETQELQETRLVKRKLMPQEWVEYEKIGDEGYKQEELEKEQKDVHREEDTERRFNKDSRQDIIEEILDDTNDEEYFEKRNESKSEGHEKLDDTRENEMILEGAACQEIECEKRQKEIFQCVEDGRTEILIDQSTEDEKVTVAREDLKNLDCNFEATNNLYEEGEGEDLNEKQGLTVHAEYDKDVEETLEVPAYEEDGDRIEVTETLVEVEENGNQSVSVEEDNGMVEKEIHETDGLAPDVKPPEVLKPLKDATKVHSSDENEITPKRNDMSSGQKQDHQLAREPEVACDFRKQVEEVGDTNKDMMEAEVSVKQEENRNNSRSSHRKRWFDKLDFSETLIKLKENGNQSESVEEENGMEEKEICEANGLAPGVKLAEILKQMEDPIETHSSEENGINVDINAMNCGQKQDVTLEKHVEEVEEINEDVREVEVAVNQEENKNNSKSSHRKRWFDDGTSTEVAQLSHLLRRKGGNVLLDHETETSPCAEENMDNHQAATTEESVTIHSSFQELEQEKGENCQTTLIAEENEKHYTSKKEVEQEKMENQQETPAAEDPETSARLQKEVEIEKELLKQKQNAKGRERERVKEKKAVERVIREARERAFAEARERAAETRQKAMAEAQERSGKTSVKANDISSAEKASREAKLKSERAAVERATEEARERALEKALSGKAYEAGKQAKRSVSEKSSGASRDDGKKLGVSPSDPESKSKYSNSSNHSDPYPAERSGESNGESAQRCKAKLERNQRTAERAAKALAEKNMRDLLVQKEQAERNRLAEGLDAEVKRWSSGKERNLRALLSTLQYILGPDSGWQPIPLTEIVTTVAVKKAYRKAALFVHPDKLQQRGASIQQKYTCEKVFDLLKEAWNRFNVEER